MLPIIDTIFQGILKFIPDKNKQAEIQLEYAKLQGTKELRQLELDAQEMFAQTNINLEEAKSENMFKAGGRPFLIWTCGAAFAWQFVLQPIISYLIIVSGHPLPPLPILNSEMLNTVLFGLLGLGAMRSYDKSKGIA